MSWLALGAGLLGAVGSYQAQRKLGEAQDMMTGAGDKAWDRGQYKPYGVTTGAGSSSFEDGQASYIMSPEYQAQQQQMFGLGQSALERAGGSYTDYTKNVYDQQRALGADSRTAEAGRLGDTMFGSGMSGLQVSGEALGAGAGSGKYSPQGLEFARAFQEQDSKDRYNAIARGEQQRATDYSIGQSMLQQGQGMDQYGMQQMELGGMFGSNQSAANNSAMGNYLNAYTSASDLMARRGQSQAGGLQSLGSSLGGGGVGNSMLSTGTIGGQNTWRDYTDNNGYGVG